MPLLEAKELRQKLTARRHGNRQSLAVEILESRRLLTSIGFLQHDLETPGFAGLFARSQAADVDGDGLADIVWQSALDLVWSRSLGDSFAAPITIDTDIDPPRSAFFVLDLDSDGDNDILASKSSSPVWYENIARGTFATSRPYGLGDCSFPDASHVAVDLDGDGDIDLLGGAEWCENQSQTSTFVRHPGFGPSERILDVADIDDDGDMDVLSRDNHLSVYRNVGTKGAARFEKHNLPASNGIQTAYFADLDGDADYDIFVGNGHWRENVDGVYSAASRFVDVDANGRIFPFDVDDDGAADLLVQNYDRVLKLYRNNGNATFGEPQLVDRTWLLSIASADFDGDGDMDLYSSRSRYEFTWFEYGKGGNLVPHRIVSGIPSQHISFGDFNGDGLDDILSLEGIEHFNATVVGWRQNLGDGQYGRRKDIGGRFDDRGRAFPFDVDDDGDLDVIVQSHPGFDWYKNSGLGDFALEDSIDLPVSFTKSVYRSDFDQDGIDELLVGGNCTHTDPFGWDCFLGWVNPGPDGFTLHPAIDEPSDLAVSSDLDGDGDEDILSISQSALVWFRNDGPQGFDYPDDDILGFVADDPFWTALEAVDLDADGDQDAVLAADGSIVWFENLDGKGTFPADDPTWIADLLQGSSTLELEVADLDVDGDLDLIVAELSPDGYFSWYENIEDASEFITHRVDHDEGISALALNDVDRDGDLDLIASTYRGSLIWYENRLVGDADDDGEVSFRDFLVLSQNFGKESDAVWENGDFNLDGDVSFEDFLLMSNNFGIRRVRL